MSSKGGKPGDGGNTAKQRKFQRMQQLAQSAPFERRALPRMLNVTEFAESRIREMREMSIAITGGNSMRRVYQLVKRPLRRRVMSFNVHRLPSKMRSAAAREMEKMEKSSKAGGAKSGKGKSGSDAKGDRMDDGDENKTSKLVDGPGKKGRLLLTGFSLTDTSSFIFFSLSSLSH